MNGATGQRAKQKAEIYTFALAGLERLARSCPSLEAGVREQLKSAVDPHIGPDFGLLQQFREYLERPSEVDRPILAVAHYFGLTLVETLAVRLATAAEEDLFVGHVLAHLQQPLATTRPTVGLLARAFGDNLGIGIVQVVGQGTAVRCGLLKLSGDDLPLPERQVRVPLPTCLALQRVGGPWPGTGWLPPGRTPIPLGPSAEQRARQLGEYLRDAPAPGPALIIRGADSPESRVAAERVCACADLRPVAIQTDQTAGMAPWLFLNGLVPVFSLWLAPGERRSLPGIPNHPGPLIVIAGPDGEFDPEGREIMEWQLEIPAAPEREKLWLAALADQELAKRFAREHRHTAARIAQLAWRAQDHEEQTSPPPLTYERLRSVARSGEGCGIGALAVLVKDEVHDDALVVTADLHEELESLVMRCRIRDQFPPTLGPSIRARFRPAVRALFVGPSGTGKTLAAAWLATCLGMPLFRVDLAAITSKYIGDTEKNLSRLLTHAERNEVLLLFDEADSLFGKRTDVRDANDRFANAQTNYLLQRMESYDGITILTSNSRQRFDTSFSRRFDVILEFALPGPEQRRALWLAHLGSAHALSGEQLNRVAAVADLSGGQIRNAVLSSVVSAAADGGSIEYRHLLAGLAGEYRKVNRQLPVELESSGTRSA